jgi:hypothetical protein
MPYPILGLGGILNMAIMFAFIFSIKRIYLRIRTQVDQEDSKTGGVTSDSRRELDRRRLRWLWVGAVIAFLTCLNALAYVRELPYQVLIAISTLYAGIAAVFVLEIRRVSERLRR